jgi:hypothetical protein
MQRDTFNSCGNEELDGMACDDCQHVYNDHYTTYLGNLQGCATEACRCTGFLTHFDDDIDVDEPYVILGWK